MYWRPNYQHPTQLLVHRVTTYLMTISTTVSHWPEEHKPGRKCFTDTFCFLPMTCFTIPNWKWDKKDVVSDWQCLIYSYLLVVQCLFPCNIRKAFSCDKIVDQFRISEAAMQTSASSNVPWSTFQTLSIDQKKIALQCRVCPTPYSPWQSLPWRKKPFQYFLPVRCKESSPNPQQHVLHLKCKRIRWSGDHHTSSILVHRHII